MKKTLCSLLTVVLLISCFAGTVNAAGRASGKFDITVTAGELKPAKTGFPMAAGETVMISTWVLAARKPITERPRTPYGTPEMDRERGASM